MYLYEAMDKQNWMEVWDTLDAERRQSEYLTAIYQKKR